MKKVIALFGVALLCVLMLTACSDGSCSHSWSSWSTVSDATCTQSGLKSRSCSYCSASESGSISPQGHNMVAGYCTVCGATE